MRFKLSLSLISRNKNILPVKCKYELSANHSDPAFNVQDASIYAFKSVAAKGDCDQSWNSATKQVDWLSI